MKERIVSVAIQRDGHIVFPSGEIVDYHSHRDLREALGYLRPDFSSYGDTDGFRTNTGRFVNRREAVEVALSSGQLHSPKSQLLSSDILSW